jgi:hypothetical protein
MARIQPIWIAVGAFVLCAYAAGLSLNIHSYLSGYRYGALRHSGVDGAVRRIVDGVIAMTAGGILGARLSWILYAGAVAACTKDRSVHGGFNRWGGCPDSC